MKRTAGLLRNKKGYSLLEILIVIAIVALLSAVGVGATTTIIKNTRQKSLDKMAETLFIAAERNIQAAVIAGKTDIFGVDGDYVIRSSNENGDFDDEDVYTSIKNIIVPEGAVDSEISMGRWLISYAVSGESIHVIETYFTTSDNKYADTFNTASADTLKAEYAAKNGTVGYYGGSAEGKPFDELPEISNIDKEKHNASVKVFNNEELGVMVRIGLPEPSAVTRQYYGSLGDGSVNATDPKPVTFKLRITGTTSNNSITLEGELNKESKYNDYKTALHGEVASFVPEEHAYYTYIPLDNLKSGKYADLVNGVTTAFSFKNVTKITYNDEETVPADTTKRLIPGEDIVVEASAVCVGEDSVQVQKTNDPNQYQPQIQVNSLFEKRVSINDSENPANSYDVVQVAYGRHLQNLSVLTSGIPELNNIKVKQTKTIDFAVATGDATAVNNDFWALVYPNTTFSPIQNSKIIEYDGGASITSSGYVVGGEGKVLGIKNAIIQLPAEAGSYEGVGLFALYTGSVIKNTVMDNVLVSGGTNDLNVGALAGRSIGALEVSSCLVNHSFIRSHAGDADCSAGGMLGRGVSVTMNKCFVTDSFVCSANGDAGGLAGACYGAIGGTDVDDAANGCGVRTGKAALLSFLNAGGVNAFDFDVFRDTYSRLCNNDTTDDPAAITIDETNAYGIAAGRNAGGLIGLTNGVVTIYNSYGTQIVISMSGGAAGGLIGKAEFGVGIEDSYADSYLKGDKCAGLVGASSDHTTVNKSYSAGFIMEVTSLSGGDTYGAGLCGGMNNTITDSFSLLNFDNVFEEGFFTDESLTLRDGYVESYPEDIVPMYPEEGKIYALCQGGSVTKSYYSYGGDVEPQTNMGEYKGIRDIIEDTALGIDKKSGSVTEDMGNSTSIEIFNKTAYEFADILAGKLHGDEDDKAVLPDIIPGLTHYGDFLERPGNKLWARVYKNSASKYVMYFEKGGRKAVSNDATPENLTFVAEWLGSNGAADPAQQEGFLHKTGVDAAPWQKTGSYTGWSQDTVKVISEVIFDESFCQKSDGTSLAMPVSMESWFKNFQIIKEVKGMDKLDVSLVESMSKTFFNCYEIEKYDLSTWKTTDEDGVSHLTDVSYMFGNADAEPSETESSDGNYGWKCAKATEFDFGAGGFDTSNVINMRGMFQRQNGITTIDISKFNTEKVQSMGFMFNFCSKLEEIVGLDALKVDTVTSFRQTFYNCTNIKKFDLTNWDTSSGNLLTTRSMFGGSSTKVTEEIKFGPKFNTQNVVEMGWMFEGQDNITELDLKPFNTAKVTYFAGMFTGCRKLKTIYASENFITEACTAANASGMFNSCDVLVGGAGTKWSEKSGTAQTDKTYAWIDGRYYNKLTNTGEGYFTHEKYPYVFARLYANADTGYTMYFEYGDYWDNGHSDAPVKEWAGQGDTGFVTTNNVPWKTDSRRLTVTDVVFTERFNIVATPISTANWFYEFKAAKNFKDINKLNTSRVTNMANMFYRCNAVWDLDLSGMNTEKVTNMSYLFNECSALREVDIAGWSSENVTTVAYMFGYCYNLLTIYATESFNAGSDVNKTYTFIWSQLIVGGNSTAWNSHDGNSYVRVDRAGRAGLFTDVSQKNEVGSALVVNGENSGEYILKIYACNSAKYQEDKEAAGENLVRYIPRFNFAGRGNGWKNQKAGIKTVEFYDGSTLKPTSLCGWFENCTVLTDFDPTKKLNTSAVKRMDYMFYNNPALTTMDVSYWNTPNLTRVDYMFAKCSGFMELDVSGLDTRNVTNMAYVFNECGKLRELDIAYWSSDSVTTVAYMFGYCGNLQTIYATDDFNAGSDVNKTYTFIWSQKIVGGEGTVWNSHDGNSYVRVDRPGRRGLFTDVVDKNNKGSALIIDDPDTGERILHVYAFESDAYYADKAAAGENLIKDIPKFNFAGRGNAWASHKSSITTAKFHDNGTLKPNTLCGWFENCAALTKVDEEKQLDTSNVKRMDYMFYNCPALKNLDVSHWNTPKLTRMEYMFSKCSGFLELNVSGLDTSHVTDMSYVFNECSNLREVDIAEWSSASVTTVAYMFGYCGSLQTIYATEDFNVGTDVNRTYTFIWSQRIVGGEGTVWNSHDGNSYVRVDRPGRKGLLTDVEDKNNKGSALIIDDPDTGERILHVYAFESDAYYADKAAAGENLIKDIPKFNFAGRGNGWASHKSTITTVVFHDKGTLKPSSLCGWFENCSVLVKVDEAKNLDTSEVKRMDYMFYNCPALTSVDVSYWNTSKVTRMEYMFSKSTGFREIDLSGLDTSHVTDMSYMFNECSNMRLINIAGWTSESLTSVAYMFGYCGNLLTIYATDGFNAGSEVNKTYTFIWSQRIVGGEGTVWSDHSGGSYVHVDKPGNKGLFTDVNAKQEIGSALITDDANTGERILHIYAYESAAYTSDKETAQADGSLVKHIDRFNFAGRGNGWASHKSSITTVVFHDNGTLKPTSLCGWFESCTALTKFDEGKNLDTSEVKRLDYMFSGSTALTTLDVSYWNTSKVTRMDYMFYRCTGFREIDLSGLDTSHVTEMSYLFDECSALRIVNIAGWSSASLTNVNYMFGYCGNLLTIYATDSFDASASTITKTYTFIWSQRIVGGDGTAWNSHDGNSYVRVDKPTSKGLFTDVSQINEIGSALIVDNAGERELHIYAFNSADYNTDKTAAEGAGSLVKYIEKFNFAGRGNGWASHKGSIVEVVFHDNGTLKPTSLCGWFESCTSLAKFDEAKNLDVSEVKRMDYMFAGCTALKNLDVSSYWTNTANLTRVDWMFYRATGFQTINLSGMNTSNVTDMSYLFDECGSGLKQVDISGWSSASLTNANYMFGYCGGLHTIYVTSAFEPAAAVTKTYTFIWCSSLVGGNGTKWNGNHDGGPYMRIDQAGTPGFFTDKNASVTGDSAFLFLDEGSGKKTLHIYKCDSGAYRSDKKTNASKIIGYADSCLFTNNGSEWDAYSADITDVVFHDSAQLKPTSFEGWFDNCTSLVRFDTAGAINTSLATSMKSMFEGCLALTSLDLRKWDVSKVTNMDDMFNGCTNLETITVDSFNITSVTSSTDMFLNCTAIRGVGSGDPSFVTTYDPAHVDATYAHINIKGRPGYLSGDVTEVATDDADILKITVKVNGQVTDMWFYNGAVYDTYEEAVIAKQTGSP